MTFIEALVAVVGGLAVLGVGGEVLLRGAVGIARVFRLSPTVIGLTVVAAGTSVPELAVSAVAAFQDKVDITVGNVVGSNIFNIACILGIVAVYRRLTLSGSTIKLEYPIMFLTTLVFVIVAQDGSIGRLDAILFLAGYVCFTAYLVRVVPKEMSVVESENFEGEVRELEPARPEAEPKVALSGVLVAVGVVLLTLGANWCVAGASAFGTMLGLSDRIIGLTVVACGTSLPELVTSLVSSYRGRDDVAIANIIGSNMFNIMGICGLTAIVKPLPVSPAILGSDNWWMLGITLLLFPIMKSGLDITRREGTILLAVFAVYQLQLILIR